MNAGLIFLFVVIYVGGACALGAALRDMGSRYRAWQDDRKVNRIYRHVRRIGSR